MAERARPGVIGVWLSEEEPGMLTAAAERAGKTVAEFLHDAGVSGALPPALAGAWPRSGIGPACGDRRSLDRGGRIGMHQSSVTDSRAGYGNCRGAHWERVLLAGVA